MRIDVASLLQGVAAHGLREADAGPICAEPLDDDSWRALVTGARHARLLGHLHAAVADGDLAVASGARSQLRAVHTASLGAQMLLEARLAEVVDVLDAAGVDHRVLKGAALAHTCYADPATRSFHDVDLLIRSEQIDRAVHALGDAGVCRRRMPQLRPGFDRRFAKSVTMVCGDRREIDLHRTLVPGVFGLLVDLDALWAEMGELAIGGRRYRTLSPTAHALHAALAVALADRPPRLSTMRDLAQLVRLGGVEPERFVALVEASGARAPVAWAFGAVAGSLDVRLGSLGTWAAGIALSARDRRRMRAGVPDAPRAARFLAELRALPSRQRPAYALALVAPDRAYLAAQRTGRAAWVRGGAAIEVSRSTAGRC